MNIIEYLFLGAFAAAVLYTGYRLFVGWLRTTSDEIVSESEEDKERGSQTSR